VRYSLTGKNRARFSFAQAGVEPGHISFARETFVFANPGSPQAFFETFRDYYGPTMNAFEAARTAGRADKLARDLSALFTACNEGGAATRIPATFLLVTVRA
jgi:hypothetical protein